MHFILCRKTTWNLWKISFTSKRTENLINLDRTWIYIKKCWRSLCKRGSFTYYVTIIAQGLKYLSHVTCTKLLFDSFIGNSTLELKLLCDGIFEQTLEMIKTWDAIQFWVILISENLMTKTQSFWNWIASSTLKFKHMHKSFLGGVPQWCHLNLLLSLTLKRLTERKTMTLSLPNALSRR